ncbi:MAG: hypothetical protein OHK0013_10240 [Sandaracinaceae bacterium]
MGREIPPALAHRHAETPLDTPRRDDARHDPIRVRDARGHERLRAEHAGDDHDDALARQPLRCWMRRNGCTKLTRLRALRVEIHSRP